MANPEQLKILRSGVETWNAWRAAHHEQRLDLSKADLAGANLEEANLAGANLTKACLARANLDRADLSRACLREANLIQASLMKTTFDRADLSRASLTMCRAASAQFRLAVLRDAGMMAGLFFEAQFQGAQLQGADLTAAQLTRADLSYADLSGARVYSASAWEVVVKRTVQENLIITSGEAQVRVNNLRVAQLIFMIRDNAKISDVFTGVSDAAVLVLGRFTPDARQRVLGVVRERLLAHARLPVIFDFPRPEDRDWTETVRILAGLSRFVIVDLTDPKSVPLELEAVVRSYQIPFVPIIQRGQRPFAMFRDLYNQFDWVLEPVEYEDEKELGAHFKAAIVDRAESERNRLLARKGKSAPTLLAADFATDS
jgi:hypothetical protein